MLQVELSTLDVVDIARIASILLEGSEPKFKTTTLLPPSAKRGDIVFSDLKLYLSSGAQFMGLYYPRGIQLQGKLTFFGKLGDFDGSFTDDGVIIKGGLDAFNVGGLEVTSLREHNGRKRATLDVELTKGRQRLFVDGVVRYHDLVLKILVDVDVQRRCLRGEIEIVLADSLSFKLNAGVEVGGRAIGGGLEGTVWWFEGELKGGVVTAVRDGILQGITALETRAKQAIEEAAGKINGQLEELHKELDNRKKVLDELQHKSRKEVAARQEKITKENATLRKLQDEIDKLDKRYREAKSKKDSNDAEIQAAKTKRDQAQAKLDEKKREMRKEYDKKIKEQKDNQAHWESERKRLKDKKEASWGDVLRKAETADRSWKYWCGKCATSRGRPLGSQDCTTDFENNRCGSGKMEVEKHLHLESGQLSLVGKAVLGEFGMVLFPRQTSAVESGFEFLTQFL